MKTLKEKVLSKKEDKWSLRNDNNLISIADIPIIEKLRKKLIEDLEKFNEENKYIPFYNVKTQIIYDIINKRFGVKK